MTISADPIDQGQNEPQVFTVTKHCRECGVEWQGNSFSPDDGKIVLGYCDDCVNRFDAEIAKFSSKRKASEPEEAPDLEPPILPGAEDYDRRYR